MRFVHPAGSFCRIGDDVSYTTRKTPAACEAQQVLKKKKFCNCSGQVEAFTAETVKT